jgi:hypothetical protein
MMIKNKRINNTGVLLGFTKVSNNLRSYSGDKFGQGEARNRR